MLQAPLGPPWGHRRGVWEAEQEPCGGLFPALHLRYEAGLTSAPRSICGGKLMMFACRGPLTPQPSCCECRAAPARLSQGCGV